MNLGEKVALSFMLSLSFTSLVTAALSLLLSDYIRYSVAVSLGFSILAVTVSLIRQKRLGNSLALPARIGKGSLPLLFAILSYVIILLGLWWSAPHYPTAEARDLLVHANVTNAIVRGEGRDILLGRDFAVGLHFAGAVVANLLQLGPLDALRIVVSPVLVAVVTFTYLSARSIFGSERIAGLTSLTVAFVLPADLIHFVRAGTFPNIVADAIVLSLVWLLFSYVQHPSLPVGITMAFLSLAGIIMHSSHLIFLVIVWTALPVVFLFFRNNSRNYLQAALYLIAGLLLLALLMSSFLERNLERIFRAYVIVGQPASAAAWVPLDIIYVNLVWNVQTFLGPINVVAVLIAASFIVIKQRKAMGPVFAVMWLSLLTASAFLSGQDWRFVLFLMLPASFAIGNLIESARKHLEGSSVNFSSTMRQLTRTIVPLALIVLALSGSLPGLVPRIFNPLGRERQEAVFESMKWLQDRGCGSGVASVGLWPDYQYLPALTGIQYVGDLGFGKSPDAVVQRASHFGFRCLVAARESPYFRSFELDQRFRQNYRNNILAVFFITY